jgi:uncharacterized membrane protein
VLVLILLLASAYYSVGAIIERTGWTQAGETWQDNTLSGIAHLQTSAPGEYAAIGWLGQPENTGYIVEAVGDDYSDYGRISAFTGRPTLLGWKGHQRQWRGDDREFAGRAEDIATIYASDNSERVLQLLQRYEVRWLVVGPREETSYGPDVLPRMVRWVSEGWLTESFSSEDIVIYEVTNEINTD